MSTEIQLGRVRILTIDFAAHPGPLPKRGDRLSSGKSVYYVLFKHQIKPRTATEVVRIRMRVILLRDMPEGLNGRLIHSAIRSHGGSLLFTFVWNKRGRKRITFEEYVARPGSRNER